MTDTPSKIQEFINFARSLKGYEKGEGQEFCVKLFQAFGHRGCIEAGAKLEYRIKPDGQHTKFADLVWRPRLLLEMKSRGEKLEKHHKQVFEYWNELKPKPRYVILCNFDEFWIYDTHFQIEEPVNFLKLEDLPKRYEALNFLFPGNQGFNADHTDILYYKNIPPNGVLQFVGREDEVQKLDELLQQQNGLKIAVIVGMGGVGKTEFAKQYALRHLQNCRENKSNISSGGVCWLDGRDGDIARQIVNFARSFLNLNPPEDWDIPTQLNYCWRNWRTGEWLIVIDDVTGYGKIKPYLPPESSSFTILLTRRENLGRSFLHLQLETLQPQPALDLLKSLVSAERIEQELEIAEKICSWLGYLPLGLELVGRYLDRDPDLSLKTILSLLEKKRLRHTSIIKADATMTAKLGVNDAFELSWERLDENAQELGCMLSLFALADIPWELVKKAYQNLPVLENQEIDLDIVEEARGDLLDFNLLERTGQGSYRVHPLIREFLRDKREESERVDSFKTGFVNAIVTIAKQIPEFLDIQHIQTFSPSTSHLIEVAKDENLRKFISENNLIWPFLGLGKFYISQGFYNTAELWIEKCLSIIEIHFGLEHSALLVILNYLAKIYQLQGRYKEAQRLLLQALEINQNSAEENDLFTADSLNLLGVVYKSQGLYTEAEIRLTKALELRRILRGENHTEIASCLENLAGLYKAQCRYTEAEPLLLQALAIHQLILVEDHPHIASSFNNLSDLYRCQNRYQEAESLCLKALEKSQRLLGSENPNVAKILNNLAMIYQSQNRYQEAESVLSQCLEIKKRLFGSKHPDVATSLNNLANLYESQGRYQEAESIYLDTLELMKSLLDEENPNVALTMNNLAYLYICQKRYSEAKDWYFQALKLSQSLFGNRNHNVARIFKHLGFIYHEEMSYDKALVLFMKALEIYHEQFGENHPDTVDCKETIATIWDNLKSNKSELPNFKPKSKKGNSQNKPKGFGKK
ncbi:tetratricopeptide repeat protein [Aphanizomenon sp. UHCC 0183]|jgi:tetratricopeptide (TPR) repeat protein|uniref:tetratricopeptide repeat protein n=1 Tax=Aphanizomenon sp. UHCC 0183 TaxID=2590028 RepID=UPI00144646A2|nr:tetratricopeptide repeat protein [Aphanizomenon sp. UHCC 0183]MTJ28362.1 tetratricopeptide repeat protein [Aphanizomenon sp. UHCC 0183]